MRLLVTRPEADAERTATALRACGHTVVVAPLLRIEPVEDAEIAAGPFAAILVTSANAAPAIARHRRFTELRALPVFAVGERSAQAMRSAGFTDVTSADGDVRDLARLVAQRVKGGASLLYLVGADRAGDLAGRLSGQGFVVRTVVIYRAIAAAVLPSAVADALAGGSMASCISRAAVPRHFCARSATQGPVTMRSRSPCIFVSPPTWRRRSLRPAPPTSGSRRSRPNPL